MGRGCGGIGLALKNPKIVLEFSRADEVCIYGAIGELKNKIHKFAASICAREKNIKGVKIIVTELFPQHVGLGSGSQLGLSIGVGICKLYGKVVDYKKIAETTGRAGVSGIGYHAFINGGLVVDGGYRVGRKEVKKNFADHANYPPQLLFKGDFPLSWKVLLILPPSNGLSGADEAKFFRASTPVSDEDANKICSRVLMGMLPAVLEGNYFEFIENLWIVSHLGTKKCELEMNNNVVEYTNKKLAGVLSLKTNNDVPKGGLKSAFSKNKVPFLSLSSVGSTLYAFLLEGYHDYNSIFLEVRNRMPASWPVYLTCAQNQPALVEFIYGKKRN